MHYPDDPRGQAAWAHDHSTDHAYLVDATSDPTMFNLANYLMDPMVGQTLANGNWNTNHQGAHDDMSAYWNVPPSFQFAPGGPGDPMWTFSNMWEHVALNEAVLMNGG